MEQFNYYLLFGLFFSLVFKQLLHWTAVCVTAKLAVGQVGGANSKHLHWNTWSYQLLLFTR